MAVAFDFKFFEWFLPCTLKICHFFYRTIFRANVMCGPYLLGELYSTYHFYVLMLFSFSFKNKIKMLNMWTVQLGKKIIYHVHLRLLIVV